MSDAARALYAQDVVRRVLALREDLVRHDENLAAWTLLSQCVPYFAEHHPEIERARADQQAMVRHILEPEAYRDYYASNPHERPFEEQYGCRPEEAHEHIHRVRFLRERLANLSGNVRVLDVSANDGWMAVNLGQIGYTTDCVDLHPGNVALAKRRKHRWPGIGAVICADLHDAPWDFPPRRRWDAVVCFECVEHVPDPDRTLAVMARLVKPDGRMYISTPFEAVEQGNLPEWDRVEPKGHVRVFTQERFEQLLARHGEIERFEIGPDRVMAVELTVRH